MQEVQDLQEECKCLTKRIEIQEKVERFENKREKKRKKYSAEVEEAKVEEYPLYLEKDLSIIEEKRMTEEKNSIKQLNEIEELGNQPKELEISEMKEKEEEMKEGEGKLKEEEKEEQQMIDNSPFMSSNDVSLFPMQSKRESPENDINDKLQLEIKQMELKLVSSQLAVLMDRLGRIYSDYSRHFNLHSFPTIPSPESNEGVSVPRVHLNSDLTHPSPPTPPIDHPIIHRNVKFSFIIFRFL